MQDLTPPSPSQNAAAFFSSPVAGCCSRYMYDNRRERAKHIGTAARRRISSLSLSLSLSLSRRLQQSPELAPIHCINSREINQPAAAGAGGRTAKMESFALSPHAFASNYEEKEKTKAFRSLKDYCSGEGYTVRLDFPPSILDFPT